MNQYKADPFKHSVIKHPSPQASSNNFLPAGDTHVIYPGKNGPLSSLRFEAHRKGIEDYELLETDYELLNEPVSLMSVSPISLKDSNEIINHIVVCGIHPSIYYFLLPLRAKYLKEYLYIINND